MNLGFSQFLFFFLLAAQKTTPPPPTHTLQLSYCGCFLKYSHKRDSENDNVLFDIYSLTLTSISK